MLSVEAWAKLAELGLIVCQLAVLGFMVLMKGTFATRKQHFEVKESADGAHHRLDLLDERLKGFPDYGVTNEIREDFSTMRETLAATNTKLDLLSDQVRRMDDFLRNHSK